MSIAIAQEHYRQGRYAEALASISRTVARTKAETDERNCLLCECLHFTGEYEEALERAQVGLSGDLTAAKTARYWGVIGKVHYDQARRQEAAAALAKAMRAARKCEDLSVLANLQQLSLIASGPNLGSGLSSAVREAYRSAVRTADASILAGFHIRLTQLEGLRGAFAQAFHHSSLAKALLERTEHVALSATFHVNSSCILGLTGNLDAARKSAEAGALLAERSGYSRLALAAAANVAHVAVTIGDLSIADLWLRKARKIMSQIGVLEVGLLETLASFALIRGDLEGANEHIEAGRRVFESQDVRWTGGQAYSLLTEVQLQKRRGNSRAAVGTLKEAREVTDAIGDQHAAFLVMLAEAESYFDNTQDALGQANLAQCIQFPPTHLVQFGELGRMVARDLWLNGHRSSARRKLLRASAIAVARGTRLGWSQSLREISKMPFVEPSDAAYSFTDQLRQAETKFRSLMEDDRQTWYALRPPPVSIERDPLDGFEDALGILELSGDPELRGREALASAISLDVCEGAALISRGDSGVRIIASHHWSKTEFDRAVKEDSTITRMDVDKVDTKSIELILKPRTDVRSLTAVSGIRRLLEAAKAIESHQKDQQRLSSLWQPEIIVEEPDAVFSSPQMIELMQTARKVAATTLPVLLMGNTGTGKEVLARAIHRASPRANKVFLPFNCSAVPRDMVESQLFGYRRGSFTGAHVDFQGVIRSAEGGTLFLDEIGELSMDLQPKLLRFLETNEVHPLGEGRPIKVDVRIIAATNADLDDLIQLKEFREDLYYRLNIVRFQMPQLCERREEIPPLAMHLLRRFEMDEKKHGIRFSDEVMEYLLLYKWPGNVRQLSNELRRMVAMVGSNETLTPEHLSSAIRATRRTIEVDPDAPAPEAKTETETSDATNLTLKLDQQLPQAVEALERAMIEHAMARADGHLEEAARLLGISRKGLFLKRRRWMPGGDTSSKAG